MNLKLLEKQIYKLIECKDHSLYDALLNYNICLTVVNDLDYSVFGFVYYSRSDCYHLIINGKLDLETQRRTLLHEIKHIITDIPKIGYIVGINMIRTPLELEADKIAESISLYG